MNQKEQDSVQLHTFHTAIVTLATVAILMRAGLSFVVPRTVKWDEPDYLLAGYNLLIGNGFTYTGYPEVHFPPLYPIVGGLFYLLVGDFEKASNLAYALFGGLLVFPVFVITQRIYGLRTACLAAILTAIFPALTVNVLFWGSLTEPLYLFLLYTGLTSLFIALEDDKLQMFPIAGAFLGLAYLTRPEAVVYLAVFFLLACVRLLKGMNRARTWYALGSLVSAFLFLAVPYIVYLHANTGQWMISGKLPYVWQEANRDRRINGQDLMPGGEIAWISPERFQDERFQVSILESAFTHPDDILRRFIKNARRFKDQFFAGNNFWWGFTPLVVITLFKEPWDRPRLRREAFLITTLLVLVLTFLPFFYLARLFAPAFPVLLIWTAQGAIYLGRWLEDTIELWSDRSLSKLSLGWLPAGLVVSIMIFMTPIVAQGWIAATFYGDKEAGLWLKSHTSDNAKVMTEELGVALYADRRWVPLPRTDWDNFLRYARDHGANYFVVREFKLGEQQPQLAHLLERGVPELELVFSFEESHMPASVKTLVYRISDLHEATAAPSKMTNEKY